MKKKKSRKEKWKNAREINVRRSGKRDVDNTGGIGRRRGERGSRRRRGRRRRIEEGPNRFDRKGG